MLTLVRGVLFAAIVFVLAGALTAAPCELRGILLSAHDADTIRVYVPLPECDYGEVRKGVPSTVNIRVGRVDAPELSQPNGEFARNALARELGLDSTHSCKPVGAQDCPPVKFKPSAKSYNRIVADYISVGKIPDLAVWLADAGLVWHYAPPLKVRIWLLGRMPRRDFDLSRAVQRASLAKRGIWSTGRKQEAPWDFRKRVKAKHQTAANFVDFGGGVIGESLFGN